MKLLFLITILSISFLAHSLDMNIIQNIHKNEYKSSEEGILGLLDGDDEQVVEAALLGFYLSLQSNNKEDMWIYYGILENLLKSLEENRKSYWD